MPSVTVNDGAVTWTFGDGTTVSVRGADFPAQVQEYLLAYGIRQKLSDSYASRKSEAERKERFLQVLKDLKEGVLPGTTERRSGADASAVDALAKAVMAALAERGIAKQHAEVAAALKKMSAEQRLAVAAAPDVARHLATSGDPLAAL